MRADLSTPKEFRCAIYTRQSVQDGLDSDFSTLDAQREAALAYITSQRAAGWVALPERYDDAGYTGANTDRPALKRLMADIAAGKVDCIAVYKIDRLSRSLVDFTQILQSLEKHGATFLSVTQQLNSTTPMGKFTLNILISFGEFERQMIADRTRDKMRAARRRGKWTGGMMVIGYDLAPSGGRIVINETEAAQVREIFAQYLELGSLIPLVRELDRRGWRMKTWTTREGKVHQGKKFNKQTLHNLLTNAIYVGRVQFEGKLIEGEHERIVDDKTWNQVQQHLQRNGKRGPNVANRYGALLKGLVRCGSCDSRMVHTYTKKRDKVTYRYYVCARAHGEGWQVCPTRSVSAPSLEGAVVNHIRGIAAQPEILAQVLALLQEAREDDRKVPMADPGHVAEALAQFDPVWSQMNTYDQERFIRTLVKEVRYDGPTGMVTVGFVSAGIQSLCRGGN